MATALIVCGIVAAVCLMVIGLEYADRRQVEREWNSYVAARKALDEANRERVASGLRPIPGGGRPMRPWWKAGG